MSTQYKHKKTGIIAKLVADHHYYIFSDPNGTGSDSLAPWLIEDSCDWEKIEDKPKVILTTEDGIAITNPKELIYTCEIYGNWNKSCSQADVFNGHFYPSTRYFRYFASEAKRDEYILNNKPLLSVGEINRVVVKIFEDGRFSGKNNSMIHRRINELISLAKSKL